MIIRNFRAMLAIGIAMLLSGCVGYTGQPYPHYSPQVAVPYSMPRSMPYQVPYSMPHPVPYGGYSAPPRIYSEPNMVFRNYGGYRQHEREEHEEHEEHEHGWGR